MALRDRDTRSLKRVHAGAGSRRRRARLSHRRRPRRCAQCGQPMNAPDMQMLPASGRGIFYDGRTAAHHDVTIELASQTLRMHAGDGSVLAEWPYDALETLSAPQGLLRLGLAGNPVLARLEIKDPRLIATIDARS